MSSSKILTLKEKRYDAKLDLTSCSRSINAELTLQLRIGTKQINPAKNKASGMISDGGGNKHKIIRWDAGSWAKWKRDFHSRNSNFWSGRMWLYPAKKPLFAFKHKDDVMVPSYNCLLDLQVNDHDKIKEHWRVEVCRLDPNVPDSFRSFVSSDGSARLADNDNDAGLTVVPDGSKQQVLVDGKIVSIDSMVLVQYVVSVHEMGHMLGLPHSNENSLNCPPNTSGDACYGETPKQRLSVMGAGDQLRASHSYLWAKALAEFAKRDQGENIAPNLRGQKFAVSDLVAALAPRYPRTLDELSKGTIISRPRVTKN
jgi:hypothetical protein